MVMIKSKQGDVKISKNGEDGYEYYFKQEPVEVDDKHALRILENPDFKVLASDGAEKAPDNLTGKEFEKDLRAIKGIGKKTAEIIMSQYQSLDDLKLGLVNGEAIEDLDLDDYNSLINKYGGKE